MIYYQVYLGKQRGLYTYVDKEEAFAIGDSVYVSFRNRKEVAYIIAKDVREDFDFRVLPIIGKSPFPDISPALVELARWMVRYYVTSYEAVLKNILTRGAKVKKKIFYRLGALRNPSLEEFCREKVAVTKASLRRHATKEEVAAAIEAGKLEETAEGKFYWSFAKEKEGKLGAYFQEREKISEKNWEAAFAKPLLKEALEAGSLFRVEEFENSLFDKDMEVQGEWKAQNVSLNEEQEAAYQSIVEGEKSFYLLKGVTGSGKTEVYMSVIRKAFFAGEGSIFLVPEISLTPQMIERFQNEFRGHIAILHSRMTQAERAKEWYSIYLGEKKIVVGVRSAIFAPVQNLKYIIMDEEHESSYKQDTNPRYHAKQVALKRAMLEGAKCILGSATPSVESYHYAKEGLYELLELRKRYKDAKMPKIEIVDMKEEEDLYFSQQLLEEMRETLLRQEQVLLLLNRKGYSTYIQCQDCGHVEECPHCSIKMSYYASQGIYKCNYCGTVKRYEGHCSECSSEHLIHSGKGIERVEEELKEHFPDLAILRVDGDQKGKGFFHQAYHDFQNQKYQVMIGTQLIAKGLHFPNVTLVGVINADMILNFPDFRAGEKTYQLLAQVAGRAGRAEKEGRVIIQTYQADHYVMAKLEEESYEEFFEEEEEGREFLEYPPFAKMIVIGFSSTKEAYLKQKVEEIAAVLQTDQVEMYGPLPSLIYRVKDRYRYQMFIKGERAKVEAYKKTLRKKLFAYAADQNLRISIDVDPLNML